MAAVGYALSIVRDALLATFYGGSRALDIYFIALSPAQFVGTEAASLAYLAFSPEFAGAASGSDDTTYRHLFRERLAVATSAGVVVAVLFSVLGAMFTGLLAPGYAGQAAIRSLRAGVVVLSALIPGLTVVGVMRADLETRARFSAGALLPGFRSGTLIICVLLSASHPALGWLLAGSLLGVMVAIAYASFLARDHGHLIPAAGTAAKPAPRLPSSLTPLVIAILLGELTTIVDNAFASRVGVGGPQAFALATNLLVAPQNIIGGGVATVFFPVYGKLWLTNQKQAAVDGLWKSIRLVAYGLLPVVVILVMFGIVFVRIIYKHGAFTEDLAVLVSQTVAALAVGQVFYAGTLLLRQFLLAAGAPWAVCEAAAVFLGVKWLGNSLLIGPFGLPGVALASSLAAFLTCAFLAVRVSYHAMAYREAGP